MEKPPDAKEQKVPSLEITINAPGVILRSQKDNVAIEPITFDEPAKTGELLGSFSKSRINVHSQRKRRPPTRKQVKDLFDQSDGDGDGMTDQQSSVLVVAEQTQITRTTLCVKKTECTDVEIPDEVKD